MHEAIAPGPADDPAVQLRVACARAAPPPTLREGLCREGGRARRRRRRRCGPLLWMVVALSLLPWPLPTLLALAIFSARTSS